MHRVGEWIGMVVSCGDSHLLRKGTKKETNKQTLKELNDMTRREQEPGQTIYRITISEKKNLPI